MIHNEFFNMSKIKKVLHTKAARKINLNIKCSFVAVFCVDYIYTKDHCKVLKSLYLSSLKSHERT